MNILEATSDPKVFAPAFCNPDTWQSWFAFLAVLFWPASQPRAARSLPRLHWKAGAAIIAVHRGLACLWTARR
jgi:hypothetical protein